MQAKTWVGISVNRELAKYNTEDIEVSWRLSYASQGIVWFPKCLQQNTTDSRRLRLYWKVKDDQARTVIWTSSIPMPDAWKSSVENVLVIFRILLLASVHSSHLCCRFSCFYLILFLFQITTFWLALYRVESVGKSVWIEFEVHPKTWPSVLFPFLQTLQPAGKRYPYLHLF